LRKSGRREEAERQPYYLLLLGNTRKTECGAGQVPDGLAVRAAAFALLRNTRKTECGADQFLNRLEVRTAPFALK
jgi:hypothetical protein